MNIVTRVINNIRYGYHCSMSDHYLKENLKRVADDYDGKFKYYGEKWCYHMRQCIMIPIK